MPESGVEIASYPTTEEAHIARNLLMEAGIDVLLADQHTPSLDFRLGPALGGIKLMVHQEDAERAISILNEIPPKTISPGKIVLTDDEMSRLAWRAAGLSIMLPPLFLYSIWLIWRLRSRSKNLSPRIRRRLSWAGVINLCVALLTTLVVIYLIYYD